MRKINFAGEYRIIFSVGVEGRRLEVEGRGSQFSAPSSGALASSTCRGSRQEGILLEKTQRLPPKGPSSSGSPTDFTWSAGTSAPLGREKVHSDVRLPKLEALLETPSPSPFYAMTCPSAKWVQGPTLAGWCRLLIEFLELTR